MTKLTLKAGKLYLLSGIPGSGKSTLLKNSIEFGNITEEMILSSDTIRTKVVGKLFTFKNNTVKTRIYEGNEGVFEILEKFLKEKLSEKLTVFVDATNISDKERAHYFELAKRYGVEAEVLILDTDIETCLKNNLKREVPVKEELIIDNFGERFQKDSIFPYRVISADSYITLTPNELTSDKIDLIGDIHGLYDQFEKLIKKAGYSIINGVPVHPDGRKLLFLGDIIDRGPDSIKMLKLVMKAVENGHYMVSGNHEAKLLKNIERGVERAAGSYAVMKTYLEFLEQIKNKDAVKKFLIEIPGYYTYKNIVMCHANIGYFDFRKIPFNELIYGSYKDSVDSDKEYQELYNRKINRHTLIRGHILETSKQENVFSLEMDGCENGKIALLPLDKFLEKGGNRKAFEEVVITLETNFLFRANKNSLLPQFRQLEKEKLITSRSDNTNLLRIYKYSKSVFYKNLWNKGGEHLLKARGIVLNVAGEIIQHPFDKIFNYKENGAGKELKDSDVVQYVQKLNGFLGNIGFNPITKDLLITTSGSFDSEFVEYIKDFIDKDLEIKLKKFFGKNKVTLSFEVIHNSDPHIIKYPDEMFGLHLIGVRGLNVKDKNWEEDDIDKVAKELGFKRPFHGYKNFGEVKKWLRDFKDEGFMIRRKNRQGYHEFLFKMKSPYYLTNKFIGRMSAGNIKFMFSNPEKFKERIADEEFFPLVDLIIKRISMEDFTNKSIEDRVSFVRNITNEIL